MTDRGTPTLSFATFLKLLRGVLQDWPTALGGCLLLLFASIAIFAPYIATHDPLSIDVFNRLSPPSKTHRMGTDQLGRDIFSRVVYGTRLTFAAGFTIVTIALMIGSVLGSIAGFWGGWFDMFFMRVVDVFMVFPPLLLALAIAAALGPSLMNAMIAISIAWWPWYTRLVRGQVLSVKENVYTESAKAGGASNFRILFHHILPNCISPVLVLATLDLGSAILTTAGLSFIGLGAQPPSPEWGAMISSGRTYITQAWWYCTFPGTALALTVLSFNLIGDGLRDILDPRRTRRERTGR